MADTTFKTCVFKDSIINWIEQTQENVQECVVLSRETMKVLLIVCYRNKALVDYSSDVIEYRRIIELLFQARKSGVSSTLGTRSEREETRHKGMIE